MSTATKIVISTIGISGFLAVAFVLQTALSAGA